MKTHGLLLISVLMAGCGGAVIEGEDVSDTATPDDETSATSQALVTTIQGEKFITISGSQSAGTYAGRAARAFWSNGKARGTFYNPSSATRRLRVIIAGTTCNSTRAIGFLVAINGTVIGGGGTDASYWQGYTFSRYLAGGRSHTVDVIFDSDYYSSGCDVNLFFDRIDVE